MILVPWPSVLATCAVLTLSFNFPQIASGLKQKRRKIHSGDHKLLRQAASVSLKPSLSFAQPSYSFFQVDENIRPRMYIKNISPGLGEENTESLVLSVRSSNEKLFPKPRLVLYFEPPLSSPALAPNFIPAGSYSQAQAYIEIAPVFGQTGSSNVEVLLRDTGDSSSLISIPVTIAKDGSVDSCVYGDWTPWSECSATLCSTKGTRTRTSVLGLPVATCIDTRTQIQICYGTCTRGASFSVPSRIEVEVGKWGSFSFFGIATSGNEYIISAEAVTSDRWIQQLEVNYVTDVYPPIQTGSVKFYVHTLASSPGVITLTLLGSQGGRSARDIFLSTSGTASTLNPSSPVLDMLHTPTISTETSQMIASIGANSFSITSVSTGNDSRETVTSVVAETTSPWITQLSVLYSSNVVPVVTSGRINFFVASSASGLAVVRITVTDSGGLSSSISVTIAAPPSSSTSDRGSCRGLCDSSISTGSNMCFCNSFCVTRNNCCGDYEAVCTTSAPSRIASSLPTSPPTFARFLTSTRAPTVLPPSRMPSPEAPTLGSSSPASEFQQQNTCANRCFLNDRPIVQVEYQTVHRPIYSPFLNYYSLSGTSTSVRRSSELPPTDAFTKAQDEEASSEDDFRKAFISPVSYFNTPFLINGNSNTWFPQNSLHTVSPRVNPLNPLNQEKGCYCDQKCTSKYDCCVDYNQLCTTTYVEVQVPVSVPVPVERPVTVEVPVPVDVPRPYNVVVSNPVPFETVVQRPVPYEVVVQVPRPYNLLVNVDVPVEIPVPVPVSVPRQVPVPRPYEVEVPVDRPVPYPVPVPNPYYVDRPVPQPFPVPVNVAVPVNVDVPVPVNVPVPYEVFVNAPYSVPQEVPRPYEVRVPVPIDVPVPVKVDQYVDKPYPVEVPVDVPVAVPVSVAVPKPVNVLVPVAVPVAVPVGINTPVDFFVDVPVPVPVNVPRLVPYPVAINLPVDVLLPPVSSLSQVDVTATVAVIDSCRSRCGAAPSQTFLSANPDNGIVWQNNIPGLLPAGYYQSNFEQLRRESQRRQFLPGISAASPIVSSCWCDTGCVVRRDCCKDVKVCY